jgi:glycosyltransferase involved in cell wall biosynthesis
MDTTTGKGMVYNKLKTLSVKHIMNNVRCIDGFVLLTEHMASALGIDGKRVVVVEGMSGIAEQCKASASAVSDSLVKIVYTGALNERYGLVNLLKAFEKIVGENYRLILCGAGDAEPLILDAARHDKRIQFMGQLPRDAILDIQYSATVLVNPRQNNEEFTKYSFPSKNIEYLSSGRPVIAYKLDGMPAEYDDHILYVPGDSIEALASKMVEVCSQTQESLFSFGEAAKNWVMKEKNSTVQAGKIIKMISEMLSGGI